MLIGWMAFSLSFLLLAAVEDGVGLWTASVFYGLFAGMSEGAERAIISDHAQPPERGTAFGWYHLMTGVAAIPAGLLFGSIWQFQSAAAAFLFAGLWACARRCCSGYGHGGRGRHEQPRNRNRNRNRMRNLGCLAGSYVK
jgi:MFS family permease